MDHPANLGGLGGSRRKYITRTDLRRFSEVGKHIGQRRCDAIGTRVAQGVFREFVAEWHSICTRGCSQLSSKSKKSFSETRSPCAARSYDDSKRFWDFFCCSDLVRSIQLDNASHFGMRPTRTQGNDMSRIDAGFCGDVLVQLINARHWLSDSTNDETPAREIAGYAERIEVCGIGIRIFLSNGCKVVWRMARQNAEFINSVSMFAAKENA